MMHRSFFLCAALVLLLSLTACGKGTQGTQQEPGASSAPVSPAEEAISGTNTPLIVEETAVKVRGVESDFLRAYLINGKAYFPLEDAGKIFDLPAAYDEDSRTASFGSPDRAYVDVPIPRLSMFPSVSLATGLPVYWQWTDGEIVELTTLTKGVPYGEILPRLADLFQNDGFAVPRESLFSQFTQDHPEFAQGERESTWLRYTNGMEAEPDAVQISDGGTDNNGIPIVKLRLYPAPRQKSRSPEPAEGLEQGKLLLYGEERSERIYLLEGAPYLAADDALTLFGQASWYNPVDGAVHVGRPYRQRLFVPDLSMFPNLSALFGAPAAELNVCPEGTTLWYEAEFDGVFPAVWEGLSAQGLTPATEEEFARLCSDNPEFAQGSRENTFFLSVEGSEAAFGLQFSPSETSRGKEAVVMRICA